MEKIADSDVKIKASYCQMCGGWVRVAVLHMMTEKSKKDFGKEVMKHDLGVKTIPLAEFKNSDWKMCEC